MVFMKSDLHENYNYKGLPLILAWTIGQKWFIDHIKTLIELQKSTYLSANGKNVN